MYNVTEMTQRNGSGIGALRLVASGAGIVAGLAGFEHGFFEVLQGSLPTGGLVTDAIGPLQRFWQHGTEPAFTIIPIFLPTGILAMAISLCAMVWSAFLIERKHGVLVLSILTAAMFLFGGGFAPPIFAVFALAAAIGIGRPLRSWRRAIPAGLRNVLAVLAKPSLILFLSVSATCIVVAVFGYPLLWLSDADRALGALNAVAWTDFFGLGPIVMLAAIASDIRRQDGVT